MLIDGRLPVDGHGRRNKPLNRPWNAQFARFFGPCALDQERIRGFVIKKDISDGFGLFVEVFWFTDETDKDELFIPHASVTQVENLEIISSCQRTG